MSPGSNVHLLFPALRLKRSTMLNSVVVRIVDFSARRRELVLIAGFLLTIAAASYDAARFSITTDTQNLISRDLPWRQRQAALSSAFPPKDISVGVTASTPENAQQATNALQRDLSQRSSLFRTVVQPDSGDFFRRSALLFEPLPEVKKSIDGLSKSQFLIGTLATDPSLRGVMKALSFAADGVQGGEIKLDQLAWPLSLADRTLSDVFAGKPATFSWQELVQGSRPQTTQLRHFIEGEPVLDFTALQPGRKATDAILRSAADLQLGETFGARVELTGAVPMNDDQFSVIRQTALRDTLTALLGALIIVWLALRSWKIVAAVFFSLMVGLATTTALGIAMVGAFNVISIAFFVLFVGLGVDFGIQFSVRYRSERHEQTDLHEALRNAAFKVGTPLSLAAAATAIGFFSFMPTSYRGLSELGQIAGGGMIIAFLTSITLLPALLTVLKPPAEPQPMGFTTLAPVDWFVQRYRIPVVGTTLLVVVLASPLLLFMRFDFNPLHLRNPNTPSVATYLDLRRDVQTGANAIEIMSPNLGAATAIAHRLSTVPQVAQTMTIDDLIPRNQGKKL